MKIALLFAAVALSACSKKDDKPAPTAGSAAAPSAAGGDCSKVTAAVDAMAGGGPMAGGAADVPGKLKQIMQTRCAEDKWPQAVIDCYANEAKDMSGMKKCREALPPELSQKLVNEIRSVMAGAAGGAMPPGHGGAGGAMPPGGAGSAGSAK